MSDYEYSDEEYEYSYSDQDSHVSDTMDTDSIDYPESEDDPDFSMTDISPENGEDVKKGTLLTSSSCSYSLQQCDQVR